MAERDARSQLVKARLKELTIRRVALQHQDPMKAAMLQEEINSVRAEQRFIEEERAALTVTSHIAGELLYPKEQDLIGAYLTKGQPIGYILQEGEQTIRVALSQDDVGNVRKNFDNIEVLLANDTTTTYTATLRRQIPEASHTLPSPALSQQGGGNIAVDPRQPDALTTFEKIFQFDIQLDRLPENWVPGVRAYVKVHHLEQPLAIRWYRRVKLFLLREFGV